MSDSSSASEQYLKRVAAEAHFHPGVMAELMAMNQRQLHRMIRRQQGCSPQEWLEHQKLKLAQSELSAGKSTEQVAADTGFCRPQSFCQWWRRRRENRKPAPDHGI